MNVQEILDKIALMVDHDLTNAQVIGQMNEMTKKFFRKFPLPEKIYKFQTTSLPYYELPDDCPEDNIRCVVINDVEYIKLTPEIQNPPAQFCTVVVGSLYINDSTEGQDAYLYYRNRPGALTAGNLLSIPEIPEDFHDLYAYDAAQWIAMIQQDVDMKNNYQSEYDSIMKDAERVLKKMGLRRAKETMLW